LAFAIVTWAAILILFLAVGAVLREVRLLRATMLGNSSGFADATPRIRFDRLREAAPEARIVLAVNSDCQLCIAAADLVAERVADLPAPAVLLTLEPSPSWLDRLGDRLQVITDRDEWRVMGHLTPPVLMRLDADGNVLDLVLPVNLGQVEQVLRQWSLMIAATNEGGRDAAQVGRDSAA
jgi:hypothetical protein